MKPLLLLIASTIFYGIFHYILVQAIRDSEIAESLILSQRKSTFEVTPRRMALKVCGCVQVICAFVMGMLVVHDVTTIPDDPFEPRVRVSLLLLPVRGTASSYALRAVVLTAGFWVFHFISDLRRFLFWTGNTQKGNRKLSRGSKMMQFLRLISVHICPLVATWMFVHWRSNSLFGNPQGEGLGFNDLLIGLLLCCLLPGLLDNTRWIVNAVDPDMKGSWEAMFIDLAIIVNRLVCHVMVWPFFLLMYHRHEHGGIIDPAFDTPNTKAIIQAFLALPLRCSIGTMFVCGYAVVLAWKDVIRSKLSFFPPKRGITFTDETKKTDISPPIKVEPTSQQTLKKEEKKLSFEEKGGEATIPFDKEEDTVADLPVTLLRRASTQDDVDWLRAQKRIAKQVKEEVRVEKERVANGGQPYDEDDENEDEGEDDILFRKKAI